MAKISRHPCFYVPYWSTTDWTLATGLALPAGITLPAGSGTDADPNHPFKSTLNERWMEFDGNSTAHEISMEIKHHNASTGSTTAPFNGYPPDSTRRWAILFGQLFRRNSTLPASDAVIWRQHFGDTGQHGYRLRLTTTGTLILTYSLSGGAETTLGTSAVTSANMPYGMEIWYVHKNASGADLSTYQWVVRLLSNFVAGSPPTVVDAINVAHGSYPWSTATSPIYGETTARGAGFKFWLSNMVRVWQDADDPYGVLRIDRMDVDGVSVGTSMDEWPGTATDVDESGTAVPDDATTEDTTVHSASNDTKDQLYTFGAPSYAVAADSVLGVQVTVKVKMTAPTKGNTHTIYPMLGDGATLSQSALGSSVETGYVGRASGSHFDAAGGALAHGDLAGMEAGVRSTNTTGTGGTFYVSTVTLTVLYQASGETTAALPAIPSTGAVHSGTLVGLGPGIF